MGAGCAVAMLVCGACLAGGPRAIAAPANLISDGGFELPQVATGSYSLFSPGQAFPPWTVIGAPGNVAPISGAYTAGSIRFVAKAGKQWLDLTGLSNSATGVTQTVTTTPGRTYRLTFSVGNVVDPGSGWGTRSIVAVLVNGRRIMRATNARGVRGRQTWKRFTTAFKATSATTTVAFVNGDPPTDNTNGLDAVRLTLRGAGTTPDR